MEKNAAIAAKKKKTNSCELLATVFKKESTLDH